MSIRLEMIQVARLAPELLGDAAGLVRSFMIKQLHDNGGFVDRKGDPDLYYTVFGLDGLQSLDALPEPSQWQPFLESKLSIDDSDFVHICCSAGMSSVSDPAPLLSCHPVHICLLQRMSGICNLQMQFCWIAHHITVLFVLR